MMDPLPIAPPSCSLDAAGLSEQLERYRIVGESAAMVDRERRRLVIRVGTGASGALVQELIAVERSCCPFFKLDWKPHDRLLSVAVSSAEHEPALEAIGDSLGLVARRSEAPTDQRREEQ